MKNIKFNKKLLVYGVAGLSLCSLTACNKKIFDFNKAYNVVTEKNADNLSIIGIDRYWDYEGIQSQFQTNDGLLILSSTKQTQLIYTENQENFETYIDSLTTDADTITWCNEINYSKDRWNKNLLDFNYSYNKAIILSDDTATIVNISKWTDYSDDKIQLILEDDSCILTNCDNIKLINDNNAEEGALEKYAASLVGNSDNVNTYKVKVKTK